MAYIDKDTAIKTAIESCVKVVGHGITQIDAVDITDAFENIPTADVVPKSEVKLDFTEEEIMRSLREADIEVSDKSISEIKAEVASEIFEEIEKKSSSCVAVQNGYEHYETKTYTISALKLDELKKKYTE